MKEQTVLEIQQGIQKLKAIWGRRLSTTKKTLEDPDYNEKIHLILSAIQKLDELEALLLEAEVFL